MTLADFLAWEETQPDRHEFVRGEVFAMVGARRVHGIVSLNIASGLKSLPRGSRCQVFTESMKLKVGDDVLVYPDVFVTSASAAACRPTRSSTGSTRWCRARCPASDQALSVMPAAPSSPCAASQPGANSVSS